MIKENGDFIVSLLAALLLFGMAAGTADAAFYFRGYSYNETNVTLNNTNVSIEVYQMAGGPPTLIGTVYNSSDATGFFNVSVTGALDQPNFFYKPVLKHFANNATSGTLDYIGQALPQFPQMMIAFLTMAPASPMNFYLRRGGTININATNGTSNIAFKYMIKDTRLGYPITENFTVEQGNVSNLYVPLERNYSIMIFPNQSLPISYDLNNLPTYANNNATITFNTSIRPRWVSGYANLSGGSSNFTNLAIIAYLMEPGNIIGKDRPMPYNMSAFRPPSETNRSDQYNASAGFYNITLPGSAQGAGANILLFATAYNSTNNEYYGAFRNITMNYTGGDETNFNFTLHPLIGNVENISVTNVGVMGSPSAQTQNITVRQLPFQLINGSSGTNITNKFAHIEIEVNYSANGSAHFKWMVDVSQSANGSFSIPAINANIGKINVFMQDFAPIKTSKNTTQLATQPVNITMTSFDNKKPDGSELSGVFIDMLLSKPECDRPVPASGCSLAPDPTNGTAEGSFDPFKIVLGGGKISLRIKQASTRITVHYKNVDMLASGPPDALFDESSNQSQSGSALEQAWRFGSKGPEIYDEVLIGVPIAGVSVSKVYLGKLYDENWGVSWNVSTNTTAQLPSDYSTFNTSWFNSTTGMPCSTTDNSSSCYIDTATGVLWLRIPHFSGVGPTVSGTSGNVTVNLTNSTGNASSSVIMNFTVIDTSNTTSWYNITFPSGFNAGVALVNITINGSADPADWTKIVTPSYVNVTSTSAAVANLNNLTYINMSGVTVPSTTGNHTINVTTSRGVTVSLNYTVVNYSVSLSVDSAAKNTNTTQNATYTLTLLNNGTSAGTYNLTVTNADSASTAALNISGNVTLAASASQTILLNVTNTAGGTYRVNVTAVSLNDTTKFSYINTTTTVTNYSVSLSVDSAARTTSATVNATYTLTLLNNGTNASTYNFTVTNTDSASTAALNISGNVTLAASASQTILLNVTNTAGGTYRVNVTAVSLNDTTKFSYINTTTTVTNYSVSLSVNTNAQTTNAAQNATYTLTLLNNGTNAGTYNFTVTNTDSASTAALNISGNVTLAASASQTILLNVTNTAGGTYRVNVTAVSLNDTSKFSYINTTTTVESHSVSLSVDSAAKTTNAAQNATYTLTLLNNGTNAGTYNFTVTNTDSASTAALNISGNVTLAASASRTILLNVTNTSSGVFRVNVTAVSLNDTTKFSYTNTTTTVPVVITIANPATNGSTNTTGYVNVTATLDATGLAQYLNWQGTNYSMTPNTSQSSGTSFYRNMTGLLSGNYSFKIYANDSSVSNASETRIITVNRTNSTSLVANISTTTFILNTTINITSPSGNVTVTIPNNTNASVSGAALTTVSIDSLAQVNSTFVANMGSSDTLIGENLSLGPDGAQFSPDIQIRFNYTDAQLTAAGISESQLSVKFYNTTTNAWVTQTTYSQNTTGNYIIVNVSHFSTFALLGTATTTTTTSGGGGTGGGGIVTSEPYTNIEKAERYDKSLIANVPVTYKYKAPELGIYEIAVTGKESENDIALRVEALKGTSKLVTLAPPGTAYKNLNILAGTKRIKEVLIRFKVENSWLTGNNFAGGDVKLVKWDGSQWVQLETSEKTKDASFTYFEAKSDSLSSFAITSLKGVAVPTATPAVEVTETPVKPTGTATAAPTPAPTEKVPGFELVLAAAALCAIYLFGRKRR